MQIISYGRRERNASSCMLEQARVGVSSAHEIGGTFFIPLLM
jgi:hypothetical protein